MNEFFTEYPPVIKHPHASPTQTEVKAVDWQAADDSLQVDRSVADAAWATPGKTLFFSSQLPDDRFARSRLQAILAELRS